MQSLPSAAGALSDEQPSDTRWAGSRASLAPRCARFVRTAAADKNGLRQEGRPRDEPSRVR
jgi:hypothetical protein